MPDDEIQKAAAALSKIEATKGDAARRAKRARRPGGEVDEEAAAPWISELRGDPEFQRDLSIVKRAGGESEVQRRKDELLKGSRRREE